MDEGGERAPAGTGRGRPYPRPDTLQTVRSRLDLVRDGVQLPAQELAEILPGIAVGAVAGSGHKSCSRATRRAAIPRAVWLLTAPRLMFIAAAISASDRSA
jgi:hypothetical protein